MIELTIFDAATGEVKRTVSVTMQRDKLAQAGDGEMLADGIWEAGKYRFVAGQPVAIAAPLPPAVTIEEVKAFAGRLLRVTDWMVTRSLEGTPVPPDVLAYRAAIRAASNEIEAMAPIPQDFKDAKWWP